MKGFLVHNQNLSEIPRKIYQYVSYYSPFWSSSFPVRRFKVRKYVTRSCWNFQVFRTYKSQRNHSVIQISDLKGFLVHNQNWSIWNELECLPGCMDIVMLTFFDVFSGLSVFLPCFLFFVLNKILFYLSCFDCSFDCLTAP